MARKRISESDLLDFRERAEELSQAVEEKYKKLDAERPAPEPEMGGKWGVLLIHDPQAGPGQLTAFAGRLKRGGIAAECADLSSYVPRDQFDKKPLWQRWLEVAQEAYQRLAARCEKVMVLGTGLSCPLACVIAEQYPVDSLVTVGGGMKPVASALLAGGAKKASYQLARLAKNNMFSIVCPILALVPEKCGAYTPQSAQMYRTHSRSDDVRVEKLPGADVAFLWTGDEKKLFEAVTGFLSGIEA